MRVALLTVAFPPEGSNGGMASFYYELSQSLVASGHQVLVATLTSGPDEDLHIGGMQISRRHFDSMEYHNLQDLNLAPAMAHSLPQAVEIYRTLNTVVTSFSPDVIECAENCALGLIWAAQRKFPLAVRCVCPQFHLMEVGCSGDYSSLDLQLVKAAETFVLERADTLTTPSRSLARIISDGTGLPLEKFKIIANPLVAFESSESDASTSIFPANAFPKLLFVGRIEELKGADLLVEILPIVKSTYPNVHLTFIGSEPTAPGLNISFADRLRERLTQLDLSGHVTFTGTLPRTSIPAVQSEADLCLIPSRYDSSPYACLEAMLNGCCVIASDVGGIPEYVDHGENGWLVKSNDPSALAEAVVYLAAHTDVRERLGEAAKLHVSSKCAPQTIATQTVALYEDAINHFKCNPPDRQTKSTQFFINAFEQYCSGPYFTSFTNSLYEEGRSAGFADGYARGIVDERNKHLRTTKSFARSLLKLPNAVVAPILRLFAN